MIDHISLRVQDFSRAVDFYKSALAPLGYEVLMEFPNVAGLGAGGKPDLWIMQTETEHTPHPTHIALNGERPQIDEFHAVAQQVGGSDNGPPGLRLDYHPHYYAAFVLDPEGNNIEVVCHAPEGAAQMPSAQAAKKVATKAAKKAPKKVAKKAMVAKAPSRGAKKAAKAAKPAKKAMKASSRKPAKGKKRR